MEGSPLGLLLALTFTVLVLDHRMDITAIAQADDIAVKKPLSTDIIVID